MRGEGREGEAKEEVAERNKSVAGELPRYRAKERVRLKDREASK